MSDYATEQEAFWAGEFGDAYIHRNMDPAIVSSNTALFAKALRSAGRIESVVELGANIGLNLRALRALLPAAHLAGVELNGKAVEALREMGDVEVHHTSLLSFEPPRKYDLALIKGVLIHIAPASLDEAYRRLAAASARYVLIAEYYNPTPVALPYRGHADKLFKRDFAGEFLDRHPDFRLLDYGFAYRRDPNFPQDDITWFLLETKS